MNLDVAPLGSSPGSPSETDTCREQSIASRTGTSTGALQRHKSEHIPATLADVDDSIWFERRQAKKKQFTEMGIWEEISTISPNITVRVMFSPRRTQPAHILSALGTNGEFIANPSGRSIGRGANFNSLEVENTIPIPFKK